MVYVADLDHPIPDADDAHHLTRVLRLRPDEPVVAGDGQGRWRLCRYRARAAGRRWDPVGRSSTSTDPLPSSPRRRRRSPSASSP